MENSNAETPKRHEGVRQTERRQIKPEKTRNALKKKTEHVSKTTDKNGWKRFVGKIYW